MFLMQQKLAKNMPQLFQQQQVSPMRGSGGVVLSPDPVERERQAQGAWDLRFRPNETLEEKALRLRRNKVSRGLDATNQWDLKLEPEGQLARDMFPERFQKEGQTTTAYNTGAEVSPLFNPNNAALTELSYEPLDLSKLNFLQTPNSPQTLIKQKSVKLPPVERDLSDVPWIVSGTVLRNPPKHRIYRLPPQKVKRPSFFDYLFNRF